MNTSRRVSLALAGVAFASTLALALLFALGTRDGAAGPTDTDTASTDLAREGAALFVGKGCIRCHQHAGIDIAGTHALPIGPNLTRYTNDPGFLRKWLADPTALRPNTTMPDLNLDDGEIERLIAFLNQPK